LTLAASYNLSVANVKAGDKFSVVYRDVEYEFEVDEDGGYVACASLYPSALSQGDTFEEALANVRDALLECLAAARDLKLEIPQELGHLLEESPIVGSAG
jgi:predicted RNase H-like HicB family nuclease